MRLYDLGVESLGQKPEALKALAWPVNAWACFVPENLNPPLNIFEKLVLSLIDKQIVRTRSDLKYVLIKEIGLNENLVENIVENCCEKHIDKRKKEDLRIKEESRKLLDAMVDGITLDMEPSDKMKKIYLFEDLITNTVIPCLRRCLSTPLLHPLLMQDRSKRWISTILTAQLRRLKKQRM